MILNVYTIYDSKAEAYHQPFYTNSRGVAIRMFTEAANDISLNIGKYPSDFTLFEVGFFDDSQCSFKFHDSLISLGLAIEYVKQEPYIASPGSLKKTKDGFTYSYPDEVQEIE